MSDPNLAKILRDTGLAEALQPRATIRQLAATKTVIDETGAINPPAAAPFRTPTVQRRTPHPCHQGAGPEGLPPGTGPPHPAVASPEG